MESVECYNGDIIRVDRILEFLEYDDWEWNDDQPITLDDITDAIQNFQEEEKEPFGDTYKNPPKENKSNKWHIGRVLYYINHPYEIRDIEIDNPCSNDCILPGIVIVDGNHRLMAARWLYDRGVIDKIHCRYGGRMDVLDYLKGISDIMPTDII